MTPLADMDERKESKSRLDVWKSCGSCKKDFKDDIPKLLPCLHTFCEPCLKANTADDTQQVKCPECQLSCTLDNVINNMFIMESKMSSEKHTSTGEENKFICTACEENQTASSFCKDCGEWLCDQCVQAHKRVRVTKDHTVVPKEDAMQNDSLSNNQKTVYCKLHRQEPLKLFCETCDKVTCRDCQLLEHKEHKYQFVHEASAKQKQLLAQLLAKVKEKQSHIQSAKSLLNNRHEEIHTREQQVIHEIKSLGEKITREVMRRLKTIAGDLEAVCANKRNQLLRVEAQIMALEEKTNHCQAFVEEAINSGTNLSLLYTKNFMRNNLKNALSSTLQVPNPNHIVDIRFSFNTDGVMNALKTLGSLHIDGAPYGSSTTSSPALTPVINGMPNTVQNAQVSQTAVQAFSNQLSVMNQNQRSRLIQAMVEFRKKQGTNNLFPLPQQVPQNRHPPQNVQVTPVPPPPPMGSPPVRHMAPNGPVLHPHQQNLVKTNSVYYPPSGVPPGQYPRYMNLNQLQQSHLVQQQQQQQQMMHHGSTVLHRPPVAAPRLPPPPLYPINSTVRTVASSNIPPTQLSHSSKELLDSTASRSLTSGGPSPGIAQSDLSSHSWPEVSHKNITPSPPRPASSGSAVSNRVNKDKIDGCMLIEPVKVKREKNGTSCCNETVKHSTDADANQNLEQAINNLPLDSSELIPEQLYPNTVSDNFISWKCMDDLGDDPNEDYCACCHNGGDLLCCDSCPKVFHLQCHIPALVSAPSCGAWNCTFCEDPGVIEEQRIKEFIVAGGTKRKAPTGLSEKELKVCERLLLELFCHSASTPFHEPVSKAVPNYYKIIVRPMDFTTVKCKLSRQHFNHYNEIEDFMIDIKLVFHNCAIYNSEVSEVGQAGKVVEKFFHELIKKYLPCYVDFLQGIDFNTSDSADMPLAKQKKTDEISP